MGLFAEELGHFLDDARHTGHTADQNDFVDLGCGYTGIFQRGCARLHRRFDQVTNQLLQLGAGQLHHHVQWRAIFAHRDERLVDLCLACAGQFDLCLLCRFFQTLKRHLVLRQVDAVGLFEFIRKVVHDAHVEVFTTQERVTVGGFHFEQAVIDLKDGHIECTAAKVIDRDGLRVFLVQTIGQGRRCRFVDDPQHFQTGNLARVFGRLTLSVVKVGRNSDHGLGDFFAQIGFRCFFHFAKDERRDLRGGVFLALGLYPCVTVPTVHDGEGQVLFVLGQIRVVIATTDQAFHAENCVVGVGNRLPFGRLPNQTFVVCERNDGGRSARAFGVFDNARLAAVHDGDTAVCRS
mmetsp:Transcript_16557/g.21276  ORF Transcript_16557/g.21276 Transcript_16557/m.21276 type:complete len:349 (-) Transcript_16557:119-1165(-)